MGAKQGAPLGLGLQSRGSGGGEPSGVHEGPVQKPRGSGMVVGDAGEEGACGSHGTAVLSSCPFCQGSAPNCGRAQRSWVSKWCG